MVQRGEAQVWSVWGRALTVVVALAAVAACARGGEPGTQSGTDPSPAGPRSAPAEAYTLRPDGTVAWVDEPISEEEVYGPPRAPRTPAAGSKPCRSTQLAAVLSSWRRPGNGGETPRGFDAAVGRLIGEVDLRNTSPVECTLRGEAPTRMVAGGREIPMLYVHGINEDAQRRVTVVPPGEHANLRLDWSGPFCQPIEGSLGLAIDLPDGGGTLNAPVTATGVPGCPRGEGVNPNARATLYASGFSEPAQPAPAMDSPLNGVTIAISGPATVAAGERMTYHVVVTNPTTAPVPLDPCPGYLVELFSMGDASNNAVNDGQSYRLNCRPVHEVPAGGSIRFEMVAQVPANMTSGRKLTATWRLVAPRLAPGPKHWARLTVRIR
ncbi:MAG TPA: hypothetical protein VFR67_27950 [Pilimelia sp.]|nr:hypothetical protein [Pilimelia sp.]